jgi:glycosyltransferase involved in cell wall biosynthesis
LVIAYDTFLLTKRFRNVGIYEYAKNLLHEFHTIAAQDGTVSIRYFVNSSYSEDFVDGEKTVAHCEPVHTPFLGCHRLWRLGLLSAASRRVGADMIFAPCASVLPLGAVPVAVTIHDAMPKRLPQELVEKSAALRAATWVSAKLSHKILTDSEHSRKDLLELYDLPPEKVSVVYLGYDRNTFNALPPDQDALNLLLAKLGIRRPYIIHHGMVQVRKNLARLIRGHQLLRQRRSDFGFQLVLAGPFGLGSEQIVRASHEQAGNGSIVFTGPLNCQDLARLIKGASLCVIPSLYEGFCLPMIEAMACGVPTIAANSSCLPEVSGRALRYFDPLSEEDITTTIEAVLEHPGIQRDLASRGLKRASEFSWQRCARETLIALKAN